MKLEAKAGKESLRWEQLEPGDYTVHYEHRTMKDIQALNPEGRAEEALFSTIAKVSELNATLYKTLVRPWVKMTATRPVADALGKLHPLRLQRDLFSDTFALAPFIREQARQARANRVTVNDDHPLRQMERKLDTQISEALNKFRDERDTAAMELARTLYGPLGLGAWFRPDAPDAEKAQARALQELEAARQSVLGHITDGGFAEAVCRIVLAGMVSIGAFERRSFRLAKLLAKLPADTIGKTAAQTDWPALLKAQARITAVAPVEALNALEQLLPTPTSRERALAVAAAVMMIEPTLHNPRSEIIEFLIGTLGVDPTRVMDMACQLTGSFEVVPHTKQSVPKVSVKAPAKKSPAKKVVAPASAKRPVRGKRAA
jgi:hypothetical protein